MTYDNIPLIKQLVNNSWSKPVVTIRQAVKIIENIEQSGADAQESYRLAMMEDLSKD